MSNNYLENVRKNCDKHFLNRISNPNINKK